MDILETIVCHKQARIRRHGPALGFDIPGKREVPLVPFVRDPLLICEIKRKSPSKGNISAELDAVSQAALYNEFGIKSVSVLTEQDHFAGSLDDLMKIKRQFPGLAVLRKDFILIKEEISISYRAGADAVLLIAAILTEPELTAFYEEAKALGMQPLVEVHNQADILKVKNLQPDLTGINCRDLRSFRIDPGLPLKTRQWITWETSLVYESGIRNSEEARYAGSSGFRGILVGEAVVRQPALIPGLLTALTQPRVRFWDKLFAKQAPYVKICGITNREDALHAARCGADILGFVFAASKRRAEPALLATLSDLDILKVAVVVAGECSPPGLAQEIKQMLDAGFIDAVQFHGDEQPGDCYPLAFPYYKALRIGKEEDTGLVDNYFCPRVLVDAFSEETRGGSGQIISESLVQRIREKNPLWLAGGMGPENAAQIMQKYAPELIDASSKLEITPGKKDAAKVEFFIKEIKRAKIL